MLKIEKQYVVDKHNKPCGVLIPIADFERMEEALENYGLAKLMDEPVAGSALELDEANKFYRAMRKKRVAR